ncbi:hypothetical protein ACF1HG_35285 [Streptomyces globisporus]|uniref:hypothetical protein n=1 Tax=Streptomyces globisporus TaxID=1908 RepID=UPI0005DDFCBF|nr:hypothetical protein [Streptomyces globisporus]
MSSSALLLALLLVLVVAMVAAQFTYVAYRHPAAVQPMLVGLTAVTLMAMVVVAVVFR